MMSGKSVLQRIFIGLVFAALTASAAFGQGTGFNFQGRLNDGTNAANGSYDLQFRLYDAITGGNLITGTTVAARPNTTVINGVFSVTLDFGATAFNNPNAIFIEIGVKPANSANAFTILGPRQRLTLVPFAVRAANATTADSLSIVCAECVSNSQIASLDGGKVTGTVLTAATAGNITGIVAIENGGTGSATQNFVNLTTDQIIEGNKTFNGTVSVSNITQPITANGLVKAMIYVGVNGIITRCYNGITNVSTGNCGFSIVGLNNGVYDVNFGFAVNNRFITITPYNIQSASISATFETRVSLPNIMIVFLKNQNNVTVPGPFMIILY
ncbi:MAG: hypothetical protein LH614_08215 [Pyrinomonadaceae bacterium]|nr:hypothetical protein [Pyrinomonadaceae bacterium]